MSMSRARSSVSSVAPAERIAATAARPGVTGVLTSLIPTGLFLLFDRQFGLVVAMAAASAASLVLILWRRGRGRGIGFLLPMSVVYVVVKGIAGVLTESEVVYFGVGLALSALVAVAVGATAFTRRPLAVFFLPAVTPYRRLTPDHPVYRRVAAQVTVAWALTELAMTGWEGMHLLSSTASEFVVTRTVVAWPIMGTVIFVLIAYVRFRLDRHEYHLLRAEPA